MASKIFCLNKVPYGLDARIKIVQRSHRLAEMHVTKDGPTGMVLESNSSQNGESSRHGFGCTGIVIGITMILVMVFLIFAYPYYHTVRSWLFWAVTLGVLLAESFVIYMAIFISQVVKRGGKEARVNRD